MSESPWHATDSLAARYADGTLPESAAWSLEKHLEHCGTCAALVSRAVTTTAPATAAVLAEVWARVEADVTARVEARVEADVTAGVETGGETGASERATARDTVPGTPPAPAPAPVPAPRTHGPRPHGARIWSSRTSTSTGTGTDRPRLSPRLSPLLRVLWAAGPAVRGGWLVAVVAVAVGAVGLAYGAGVDGTRPLLLAIAPVVPVAGVALSYGRHADPLYELVASTPSGGLRLMLTRTAAVLAVSLPLLTLTGLLLPAPGTPNAAAWLLPGLALTLAALALAGYVGLRAATAVTGGGWLAAVLVPALTGSGGTPPVGLTTPAETPAETLAETLAEPLAGRLAEQLSRCLDGPLAQSAWAAAAVLSAALLAVRRSAYDRLEQR
ncbi:zf-HC2 domain-containing protein [Streptomyces antibioticus]|uniref:zf-HC2 domain-containing protein n=1 Tax=Streptomyces antibioticus TaxID=1890 RepID=UPI002257C99B|nr:zf-HC2 domain-containing protein [Streptomyces antibioticus]MCX4739129.1 zf-HC2 domain-containing protein [Streptomyces antibioticus]